MIVLTIQRQDNSVWNHKYRYRTIISKFQTLTRQTIAHYKVLQTAHWDTSSIEVIQPNEGLEIRLPINPPQRALPNSPESPRTNVAVPIPDTLLTEDEETGDQAVPPTVVPNYPRPKR